jgi:riboflavin synthase
VFTGIVRELGRVADATGDGEGMTLRVEAPHTAAETAVGDSVAVNGVCLTAEAVDGERITFHIAPETLQRSALATLAAGRAVNVEPAVRAGEPLGGHLVQGHVDDTGKVRSVEREGHGLRIVVEVAPRVLRYCVVKGSVTLDGVSLTVAELHGDALSVALVPHTLAETTLGSLHSGDEINVEVDVLAKYVERLLGDR